MTREQLDALKVDLSDYANWAPTTRILVLQMFEEYASQRALIEQQAKEVARLRGDGKKFVATFLERMNKYGQWEDGCFYYNRTCASELQEVIAMAKNLKEEHS